MNQQMVQSSRSEKNGYFFRRNNFLTLSFYLASFLFGTMISNANAGWKNFSSGYEYKSESFSCKIKSSGTVKSIQINDKKIFSLLTIFGLFKQDGVKGRCFQSEKAATFKVENRDEKTLIDISGKLVNAQKKEIATFKENITLLENEIKFEYKVKTSVQLEIGSCPFSTLALIPIATFKNFALDMIEINGKRSNFEIQKVYERKLRWPRKLKWANITGNDWALELALPPDEQGAIELTDERSWGVKNKNIQILVKPFLERRTWKKNPKLYPAGTKLNWSFTIKHIKY